MSGSLPSAPLLPEKRLRDSKKAIVAIAVIEQLLAIAVALGIWGSGPWPSVVALVIAGAVAGTYIWGQAWLSRYVRVAWFSNASQILPLAAGAASAVADACFAGEPPPPNGTVSTEPEPDA